ncbi:MAG: methylenetetrahydrofolate reductase [NAD(P)H] [Hyphomicrobiales bacterium]
MISTVSARVSRDIEPKEIRASFEFFPPKSPEADQALWTTIRRIEPLDPAFVSVTYGAGGTTRERTLDTVTRLCRETTLKPAAHFTCVGASKSDINSTLEAFIASGVRHIVALRGDPQGGIGTNYEPHPDGYAQTSDLVAAIRAKGDIEVSVSAYPEKHPESATFDSDLDALKAKIDAGATRAITQFFFDNDVYFRYLDKVRAKGINIPIVPGILPVENFSQTAQFAGKAGTSIPAWFARRFDGLEQDRETRRLVAAAVAAEQVFDLLDQGVADFHFYTMNRADLAYAIAHLLGLRPASLPRAA